MNQHNSPEQPSIDTRAAWMSTLAKAPAEDVVAAVADIPDLPAHDCVRGPETGLVMVRARAGGTGERFNFGEMTVTRCTVRTSDGATGHSYVPGTSATHAEAAALLDALLQSEARRPTLQKEVVRPLRAQLEAKKQEKAAKSAATKVDFFTMVRGED